MQEFGSRVVEVINSPNAPPVAAEQTAIGKPRRWVRSSRTTAGPSAEPEVAARGSADVSVGSNEVDKNYGRPYNRVAHSLEENATSQDGGVKLLSALQTRIVHRDLNLNIVVLVGAVEPASFTHSHSSSHDTDSQPQISSPSDHHPAN